MKTINLFKVIFLLFLTIAIVSCNKDDDGSEPGPPLLPITTYETTFNVTLGYTYKVTDTNTGQVLVDVDYGVDDVSTLVYVIHRKSDGEYLKLYKMDSSSLKDITTDNITTVKVTLPEGKYYITFVAFKDFVVEGADTPIFLRSLTQKYNDAAMQIPNDYVHYVTTEFEVSAIDGANKPMSLNLGKMTTDLIFEFADADKVPDPYDYCLTMGVENIPSAFLIATGKTLTAKETEEKKLHIYSGEQNVPLFTDDGKKAVVTTFHTLSNDNLPAADRGRYWFEFKESCNEGKQIKTAVEYLDKFTADHSSSMYIYGLYDKEQPVTKTVKYE